MKKQIFRLKEYKSTEHKDFRNPNRQWRNKKKDAR